MKRKKENPAYDRSAVGKRVRERREELGWSRSFVANQLGLVSKYYGDIERGTCGMSVETLLCMSRLFGLSMDYLICGETESFPDGGKQTRVLEDVEKLPSGVQERCLKMLWLFLDGIRAAGTEGGES
ncbi:MAG: helix-turn-helix transcriptional regulator [Eubacteriales bacterium]|nr:helix-turn-helix transcriptional regulator [Eubacteriales bacterium]